MIAVLWAVVIGLPLAVLAAAILWPERIPRDRSVDGIRERIETEDTRRHRF
ncbi:hypothetical protein [Nocardia cyriacigeorgica]|uniref:hypothetical protein n=1 Tax=Nocardia cyriacigeorgica TaxID=135487 RepID=UPI001894B77A|nr:hypothetical protein [Nocardia cyriacigeorgica]MBF6161049.1 hypothetical protein [Nocardia cyriacigeorgica]MBF6199848.1 hypothetical protein [Nocardia cyriacigeorgica]